VFIVGHFRYNVPHMVGHTPDRRIERTRSAIVDAFGALFFDHGYERIDVQEVARRANVGRSTFYRHFRGKEDLLVQSLAPLFCYLADACISDDEQPQLRLVCGHFWENRRRAPAVFSGRSMNLVVRALARAIEARLASLPQPVQRRFPIKLLAGQLAAGQMALLDEWLRGRGSSSPAELSNALHRSSRAIVRAMLDNGEA